MDLTLEKHPPLTVTIKVEAQNFSRLYLSIKICLELKEVANLAC